MSLFDELGAHSALPFEQARMLPLAAYESEAMQSQELTELFGTDWLCVARTVDVPQTGDYVTAEIPAGGGGQRSVIVMRADDGEVRAFDNVCVHRGSRLLDGCGTSQRITCPYHAWVYRNDGSLIGGPHMGEGFDPADHHLVDIATEIWQGFVFVNQRADPPRLADQLGGLTDVVGRYAMADYVPIHEAVDVWETNWKLLVENFMDAYHIFKVHKASFGVSGDSTLDTEMFPGTDRWAHHLVVERERPDLAHPTNTVLTGPWRKTTLLAAVFPGFVVQLQPDWMWFLRINPLGTDRVRIAWQVSVAPEMLAGQTDPDRYVADLMALIDQVNSEDQPIVEGIRRGVHRPQFERAPLSYLERNVYDFDRYITTRLGSQPADA